MANLVELSPGEHPVAGERHALVVAGPNPPPEGAPAVDRGSSRIFYATDSEWDIALITGRAMVWANQKKVPNIYLRREGLRPASEGG